MSRPVDRPWRWVRPGALGEGRLRFGADYNPEQWPRETWADDMRLMRKAGVNIVSLGIFSWGLLEPRPGEWDFAWLDEVMDLLHDNSIDVDLATATASPPPWLTTLHPEILPITQDGRVLSPGSRQHWRPTSPVFREYALRMARRMAERYSRHPALVAWHISNELGCHNAYDYSEDAARSFRDWLRHRYQDIDTLNEAWGTAFWSQWYGEWNEILPPRIGPTQLNPGQQLDFERFSSDALRDYLRTEAAMLSEVTPDVPRTTNFMVGEPFGDIDYATWVAEVDFLSNDHYLRPGERGLDELSFSANLTGNLASGRPWFLMEHSTSAVNWRPVNPPKREGELARDSLTHVAHGADAVCFFQWRQSHSGGERFHAAMVPHAGETSDLFRDVTALGALLADLDDVSGSRRETASVAILFDWESWWVSERDSHPSDLLRYRTEALAWYSALLDAGIRADVVPVASFLDPYSVVIAPMLHVVPATLRERLHMVVESGRHLIATYFSGVVDDRDRVWLGGYPGALRDVLGIVVDEFVPLLPGETITLESGAVVTDWTERITSWSSDVEILDRYADGDLAGRPAVTRRTVGVGSATYVSARLDVDAIRSLLQGLSERIDGLRPEPAAAEGALEIVVRRAQSQRFVFAINRTDDPIASPSLGALIASSRFSDAGPDIIPPRGVAIFSDQRDDR